VRAVLTCVICHRLQLEREPFIGQYETRRKAHPVITRTTLLYRQDASADAEILASKEDSEFRPLSSGDLTICKIFKGRADDWQLSAVKYSPAYTRTSAETSVSREEVSSEVFLCLKDDSFHYLSKGMSFRFGLTSVFTITSDRDSDPEGSSSLFNSDL